MLAFVKAALPEKKILRLFFYQAGRLQQAKIRLVYANAKREGDQAMPDQLTIFIFS